MGEFGDLVTKLREESPYPTIESFVAYTGTASIHYREIERGTRIPKIPLRDQIISRLSTSKSQQEELIKCWNRDMAKRMGVELGRDPLNIDIPEAARKIQRELEFELQRLEGLRLGARTRRVCVQRLETILETLLGDL